MLLKVSSRGVIYSRQTVSCITFKDFRQFPFPQCNTARLRSGTALQSSEVTGFKPHSCQSNTTVTDVLRFPGNKNDSAPESSPWLDDK